MLICKGLNTTYIDYKGQVNFRIFREHIIKDCIVIELWYGFSFQNQFSSQNITLGPPW